MTKDLRTECARVIWETAQRLMGSPGIPAWDAGEIADALLADGLVQMRARTVERHLQQPKTGLEQDVCHARRFRQGDAAQDRHQRKRITLQEIHHDAPCGSKLASGSARLRTAS